MKRNTLFIALAVITAASAQGQTLGYVLGSSYSKDVVSFSTSTGKLVNVFSDGFGTGTALAVGSDDSTLYIPAEAGGLNSGVLNIVSGQTGQLLNSVSLVGQGEKAVLSADGSTVYVQTATATSGGIVAVDTATLASQKTLSFPFNSFVHDIAVSPDSSTLYVYVTCPNGCTPPRTGCTTTGGICIFDAKTLAFKQQIDKLQGSLALSQDGQFLYVWSPAGSQYLAVVNTAALTYVWKAFPYRITGVAVNPVGNYAVVFVGPNAQASTTAYLFDPTANKTVAQLFGNGPDGTSVIPHYSTLIANTAAFSPDGTSLWMLLWCDPNATNCSVPGGTGRAVMGISMISPVSVISIMPLPRDAASLGMPQ